MSEKTVTTPTLCEVQTQIPFLPKEKMLSIIAEHTTAGHIKEWAYILHDKDIKEDGTPKEPHWHIELRLTRGRRLTDIASWFGLPTMCIQTSKSGRYEPMLQYLIHENFSEKHQYAESEVVANFNYSERLQAIRDMQAKKDAKKAADERIGEIIELIANGTVREFNIDEFVTAREYDKYRSHIKNALEYRSIILEKQNTRNMEVIYIYGKGGTGKSSFAETIAKERGFSFKRSASERDPLATYKGQDSFALDDVRGNTFEFQDWQGVLDNFQDRPGSSRFHDKHFTECKLLFITTTDSAEDFWKEMSAKSPNEDPHQFFRRIKTVIHMTGDEILCKRYDEETHRFGKEHIMENDTYSRFDVHSETAEEQKEKLAHSLGVDKSRLKQKIKVEKPEGVIGEPIPFEAVYPTIPKDIIEQVKHDPWKYLEAHPEHKAVPLNQL